MTDTKDETEQVEFTEDDAATLKTLQSVQKANFGRMEAAHRGIESTGKKISDLLDRKWAIAPTPTYVEDDDYEGMLELWRSSGSDVLHRRKQEYVAGWAPGHFTAWGHGLTTYMPSIDVTFRHDDEDFTLVQVGEAMLNWASFMARHAQDEVAKSIRTAAIGKYGTHPEQFLIADDENDRSTDFKILDFDLSRFGVHMVRVFPDATGQRIEVVNHTVLTIDTERRPLFDVLVDVRENWYYPDDSNPDHKEEHPSLREEFGWGTTDLDEA